MRVEKIQENLEELGIWEVTNEAITLILGISVQK